MFRPISYSFISIFYVALCLVFFSTITAFSQDLPKKRAVYHPQRKAYIKYKTNTFSIIYDTLMKVPMCATYKLYKGGGDCSRKSFYFKKAPFSATSKDYATTGYDQGHLVNAEDFAYSCTEEAKTFTYYNCSPQTPQLNRGIWKVKENSTRTQSQYDSLNVIVGCLIMKKHKTIGKGVAVPEYYYRIVQSLTTKKIVSCVLFTNTNRPTLQYVTYEQLDYLIPFVLPLVR